MFIVNNYPLAIIFCVITMLCWGSWGNTQKLAGKTWRYELFYWDYVIGVLLLSLIFAFTLGSMGSSGRGFIADLGQADMKNIGSAFLGGIIFNAANILLSAAIAIAGMSVAFPVGIGLALVLGVIVNYMGSQKGDPLFLFLGVGLITLAIIVNAFAYKKASSGNQKVTSKGIFISILAGLLMSFFYRFVAASMDLDNFESPAAGKMTPYTAVVIFSLGIFISNFLFNTVLMKKPISGEPTNYKAWFKGKFSIHWVGILGGLIWGVGNSLNLIAAGKAGAAISYGLGQGATLVAALWGVFIWKEFKNSPKGTNGMLVIMFVLFVLGLASIIYAGQ
ncbi:MAG: multidrug DMT transporter permease [Bacteroidetes bacterium GWF2_42_66]|nr:MAG: multidrug DMT transporter permease [Bacteroidetes bacterium GWA2_42_15]OFY01873.1 MAG: multidrug DMT transporter permease [Bacteroidetes bacterium GWE2_42_39]OFY44831.1 MAG: multidrug DMT transporter permease [Bacteroidetes bacterium GWF2_42_66]HBL75957.1 multidrug DMT transporter permease [Prolixibacteraceae bacterium]HCR89764.1 multidrug DMT transporter permease [Prolixibacteraceae bacterium]